MIIISGYQLTEKIYEDFKIVVYRGQRDHDKQAVILKIFTAEYPSFKEIATLKHEYEITKSLDIKGIVKPYSLEKYNNGLALVMEDFGGKSLDKFIAEQKIDLALFLKIGIQLAAILGEIHESNIIHRDIKPLNIIFNSQTEQAKIADFSIASSLTKETQTISNVNLLEGTLAYISPEQTGRMNRVIDYRTDFYSLGVTFYEMLAGQLPFSATDLMEMVHCHIAKTAVPVYQLNPTIPKVVSDIVMKLLAKMAEDRYQSAYGIKFDLEACLTQLQATGKIDNFVPGQQDVSAKFQIPQTLYGREQEIATLIAALNRVCKGATEIVLVSGYSGIGKTALIQEIYKPITQHRGYFISGKFDQYKRNIPYASLIQAFQELIRQLLTESQEKIKIWKEKLLAAFVSNGQVIVDVIPEVELIVGKQPPIAQLEPTEAKNRFNLVLKKFIGVFTQKEHPLVLFLDDLQWADSASLQLLQQLPTSHNSQYLLIIGAYRENEVNPAHPLMLALDEIEKTDAIAHRISLKPLESDDITQLLAQTLHCQKERAKPLAKLMFNKTAGNPFFLTQLLTFFYQEKLLKFDSSAGCWQWDIELLQGIGVTDNVIELMVSKIQQLAERTQNALKLAACIGNTFDLDFLALVAEESVSVTAVDLLSAVEQGLILPLSDAYNIPLVNELETPVELKVNELRVSYKFLHDRVRQAVYFLISKEYQQEIHLKISRLLLQNNSEKAQREQIFEIVNHMNFGIELITDSIERCELAKLNLAAGRNAKASTAYETALKYFYMGLEALPGEIWEEHYELAFSLSKECSECEYLCGNFQEAEKLFNILLSKAKSKLERTEIWIFKTISYTLQYKPINAIKSGMEGLRMLGLNFPETEEQLQTLIESELGEIQLKLYSLKLEDINNTLFLAEIDQKTIIKLLSYLCLPAQQTNKKLFYLLTVKMLRFYLIYGFTEESPAAFCNYAIINACTLKEYKKAYEFANFALKLNEKFNNHKFIPKINFWYSVCISHWRKHLKHSLPFLMQGYQYGLESGDLAHSIFSCFWMSVAQLILGNRLSDVYKELKKYDIFFQQNYIYQDIHKLVKHVILCLQGLTNGVYSFSTNNFNEDEFLASMNLLEDKNIDLHFYHQFKLEILWIFGNYNEAVKLAFKAEQTVEALTGSCNEAEHYLYYSLSLTAVYITATVEEQKRYWQTLEKNQQKMKLWADNCPENYLHKYLLVAAEIARITGNDLEAMDLYEQAIKSAHENEYTQNEAIANELAAKFYLAKGKEKIAKVYMQDARYGYVKWGATSKVRDLDEKYPQLLTRVTTEIKAEIGNITSTLTTAISVNYEQGNVLDLITIVKASQALAGEIVLGKLLDKLLKIMTENAGAQTSYLILKKGEQLFLEASYSVEQERATLWSLISVACSQELPADLIDYVARTQESVVLNDATRQGNFTTDPYIVKAQPKSILCVPIIYQGKLIGLLYSENNLMIGAFTPDRLEVLKLLSAQAAISLENALLYADLQETSKKLKLSNYQLAEYSRDLEQRVEERTQELTEKNSLLTEQATQLEQAMHELTQAEERYRLMAENSTDMISRQTLEGVFLYASPACRTLVGYEADELLGRSIYDFCHPQDFSVLQQCNSNQLSPSANCLASYRMRCKDGNYIWIESSSKIINDPNQSTNGEIIVVSRDITQRKLLEEELRKALEKEKELSELKTRFVSMTSHEFRTPLTTILSSAELIEDYGPKLNEQRKQEHLHRIQASAKNMTRLLEDVLLIGKVEAGKVVFNPVPLNIEKFCQDLVEELRLSIGSKHTLTFVSQNPLTNICLDEKLLRHILSNLLSNALKYSPLGSTVSFELACFERELVFRIQDQGIGIPPEDLKRLFETFHRAKNVGTIPGTGLGLAIVKKSVDLHGGKIVVSSEVGVGTTFTVTVPY